MSSKTLVFFCMSLAIVLMITSGLEVAARELAETTTSVDNREISFSNANSTFFLTA